MKVLFVVLLLASGAMPAYSEEPPTCPFEKIPPMKIGSYTLTISEFAASEQDQDKRDELQDKKGYRCLASVTSKHGKRKVVAREWDMWWLPESGKDLNGDGMPDAVAVGYWGGAHCCWTYWFVSLGRRPRVYLKLENERDIRIDEAHPGHIYIRTLDGAFDYFDGLCHACTPFPAVTLEFQGVQLVDVSNHFLEEYDKQIEGAKRAWQVATGEEFASLQNCRGYDRHREKDPCASGKYNDARSAALSVVLAYLYSGREQQAWKALDEMWPASDRARIKKLILKTRAEGVLSQIGVAARKSGSPQAR